MPITEPVCFFFGANTPDGFYGFHQTDLYHARDGWVAFLIKSGAGTGKATFMRRVRQAMEERGIAGESVLCSSDPDSLDAVVYHDLRMCVIDATAPHVIEPIAYGECEQLVPFGCCLKPDIALQNTAAWFEAADACAASHARCCRFLSAAAGLLENNRRLQEATVRHDKIEKAAKQLAFREWGTRPKEGGTVTRRFLSAVTPQGAMCLFDTATALCPKVYVLEDTFGATSSAFLKAMLPLCVRAGQRVIACPCPLSPADKLDHLLCPDSGVAFLTSNPHHHVDFPVYRRIHAARFTEGRALSSKKQQLRFNRRAADDLLCEAVRSAVDAKAHHDRMEARHTAAMDWERWETIADDALTQFLSIAEARMSKVGR